MVEIPDDFFYYEKCRQYLKADGIFLFVLVQFFPQFFNAFRSVDIIDI